MQHPNLYFYKAQILSVYDGDTLTAMVDLGFDTYREMRFRLAEIDTPELRGKERPRGLIARDALIEQLDDGDVIIESIRDKKGKYGRYLAVVWKTNALGDLVNLNQWLLDQGFAEKY